ncbi:MAG: deoxyribonuclease IV [Candidatus Roizmanbacteria bacterium]|nr:MAG: deoxyribonuclease IV [Candidatus Roizmanbacteria bacterium]
MAKLGAHLSISGGYVKAIEKVKAIGGNCLQIFSSSPRSWNSHHLNQDEIDLFKTKKATYKINPIYFHGSYLINLADRNHVGRASKKSLIRDMQTAFQLGIKGCVIHLGSYKDNEAVPEIPPEIILKSYDILIENMRHVLAETPSETLFIIENSGIKKIGLTIDELAKILTDIDNKRVRVCFDTCHLHAGGYNLSTQELLDQFLNIFNSFIGLDKLELWHLNDSKDPFSTHRDRHENIGQGHIGTEVFRLLLNHPLTKDMPFIIETPGFDGKGPDKENLDILKNMIGLETAKVIADITPEEKVPQIAV